MSIINIMGLGVGVGLIYTIMGMGAAKAYGQARGETRLDIITIFLWPIALCVWAFTDEI